MFINHGFKDMEIYLSQMLYFRNSLIQVDQKMTTAFELMDGVQYIQNQW